MEYLLAAADYDRPEDIDWDTFFDFDPTPELHSSPPVLLGKRRRDWASKSEAVVAQAEEWLHTEFPELYPSPLPQSDRSTGRVIPNPLVEFGCLVHPRRGQAIGIVQVPTDGRVDGLIKFHMRAPISISTISESKRAQSFPWAKHREVIMQGPENHILRSISTLPPDFGRDMKLNGADEKLWNFYLVAICSGVTLIPSENAYVHQIAPIAMKNDCVKHSVLALAATYILDYATSQALKARADYHWRRAIHLLSRELNAEDRAQPGKEEAILAALTMFFHNEVVNIELNEPGQEHPRWYRSALLAERILAESDPMYHYRLPQNVQCNRARIQLGNKVALYNVLSGTVWPLDLTQKSCPFTWLLEGSYEELHKICGVTGLSPRLMHTFAQITYLASRLYRDPKRITAQKLGKAIGSRLHDFWQWSDLSAGYSTSAALLDSCVLDSESKVYTPTKVTELVAETYAAAAQIYLFCRLLRKSRHHPRVQAVLTRLLCCLDRIPTSGPLFTGQHAQVRVFIAGIVAVTSAHRSQVSEWFSQLVRGTRGNVPPVWRAMQALWRWLDSNDEFIEAVADEADSVFWEFDKDARPWWEDMVAEIFRQEGKLNLA